MQPDNDAARKLMSRDLLELVIRISLIGFMLFICARIIAPFATLMAWALILAVALYPLHQRLTRRLGGRQVSSATLIVMVSLLLIAVPSVLLINSFAGHMHAVTSLVDNDTFTLNQPDPAIAEWPLVGEKLYSVWSGAAQDVPAFLESIQPQLIGASKAILSFATSMASSVFVFFASLIVAGIMMAYGESGDRAVRRILSRIGGPNRGVRLQTLSTATIRSVATGVIGVAFIQSVLLGFGFVLAGIPAAGVLALMVLLLGIAQLPLMLVSLPAIAYIWWADDASAIISALLTGYILIAGMADNLLKPLLLGRGVDAPMPVILLGALGGMVAAGIIGLFVGAVLLAVGYQIFMEWVNEAEDAPTSGEPDITAPISKE